MSAKIPWLILGASILILGFYFLFFGKIQIAGDIVEYYGMTVSILNHGDVSLRNSDKTDIEKYLPAAYFSDPQYYMVGANQVRYPVHFPFYAYLLIPSRIILSLMGANPMLSFPLTNILILASVLIYAFRKYIKEPDKRLFLLFLVYFSPLIFFLGWPGPEIYYTGLIFISILAFISGEYFLSAFFSALASWQSQPLIVVSFITVIYMVIDTLVKFKKNRVAEKNSNNYLLVIKSLSILLLMFIPYVFSYFQFGLLTPWTNIRNGWTEINGFGLQNISLKKLFEQFFDLNMGLFWYAPFTLVIGFYYLIKRIIVDNKAVFLSAIYLVTAFFYQTNPAWNYGTAGYGPTRHIVYILPLFIVLAIDFLHEKKLSIITSIIFFILLCLQTISMNMNGWVNPDFRNSLRNNYYAIYILDNFPSLYNPTPEIFVDRTNQTDLDHPTSGFYKYKGYCTKAYVLSDELNNLENQCGYIPTEQKKSIIAGLKTLNPYQGIYVNY
ncbi:hypothetical protein M1271_03535 [Patescibacteria group bacterium]|nr:hypothetical protein [Patescibacteria group bacterium]MCL5797834.1 hypothetical protein [Patescibacteria group bacterium]